MNSSHALGLDCIEGGGLLGSERISGILNPDLMVRDISSVGCVSEEISGIVVRSERDTGAYETFRDIERCIFPEEATSSFVKLGSITLMSDGVFWPV